MELPASEILGWEEYFSIVPFTQDREDARVAQIAQTITNMAGKELKRGIFMDIGKFIPDFWNERDLSKKSEQAQIDAEKAFVAKAIESGFGIKE